jgi:hypothetical protein
VNDGAAALFRMDGTARRSVRLMRIKAETPGRAEGARSAEDVDRVRGDAYWKAA